MTGKILAGCEVLRPMDEPVRREATADDPAQQTSRKVKGCKPTEHTRNRFAEVNAFVDVALRELEGTSAKVWLILWRDTKPNGSAATSQQDLARRAGVSVRTIYTALKNLESAGLLTVVRRGSIDRGSSVYRVWPIRQHEHAAR